MTDQRAQGQFVCATLFAVLVAGVIFLRLLPLGTAPTPLPGPDLIFCLVIAWCVRRPDLLPVALLVPILFLSDLLLMRPPGLYTALVLAVTEALRRRHARLQTLSFMAEVAVFGALSAAVITGHWLVLALLAVDQPALPVLLAQAPVNAAVYPAVALFCHVVLGLRKRPALASGTLGGRR